MSEETPIERRLRASLPDESAPDSLWERIEAERTVRAGNKPRHRRWLMPTLALGTAASAAALGLTLILRPAPRPSAWTYQGKTLAVGETVTAKTGKVYLLQEPSIGRLTLMPGTRLKIADSSRQKRLKLEQGRISALVTAPPRLFAVETGNGIATDLGCAYELQTAPVRTPGIPGFLGFKRPETWLRVKTGWVELTDRKGGTVLVPAGASCHMVSSDVGLPHFDDAPEALSRLNSLRDGVWPRLPEALQTVKRPKDSLTLFYLLPRVGESDRIAIWTRLLQLVPPPKGVTKAALLARNTKAISAYEERLKEIWNPIPPELWNQFFNDLRSLK